MTEKEMSEMFAAAREATKHYSGKDYQTAKISFLKGYKAGIEFILKKKK